jgi:DNA adenine methylase
LPAGNKLIEPFVGAGSVFLNTTYSRYLLNDINPDLITLYQLLKKQPSALIADTKQLFCAKNNTENQYYSFREAFNASVDPWERSVLFIYLNRHGYNGLCRYNAKGKFNVPFGRYKNLYFPEYEMWVFAEKSRLATFTCLPFEELFKRARKGNVIYCDPPYLPISHTASFTAYAQHAFNLQNQTKLANLAHNVAKKRHISVLLSNNDLPEIRSLYEGADITSFEVKRTISQNTEKRNAVKEVLALFKAQEEVVIPNQTASV